MRSDQARLVGENHGLHPVAQSELAQDPRHVGLHRRLTERQLLSQLTVAHPPPHEPQHL